MKIKARKRHQRKLKDSEIINFTINKSNVYNESNALATTNTIKPKKIKTVKEEIAKNQVKIDGHTDLKKKP